MDLTFITVVTGDLRFCWETEILCNNLRKYGYSKDLHVIVDENTIGEYQQYWDRLIERYNEVKFFHYNSDNVTHLRKVYPPLIRPHLLKQHFKLYPKLSERAIFYLDSDIVFTKYLDFTPFLSDNVCYLSDTTSYISANYFDSKIKDVVPRRLEKYKTIDVLDQTCKIVGITGELARKNNEGSGGAQYLMKGIDYKFWEKVEQDSIHICLFLKNDINNLYFESQNKGFQAWCADMWAVLWNIWLQGKETKCPKELDFCWATNKIDRWNDTYIFHNAGVTTNTILVDNEELLVFNKINKDYLNNIKTPFDTNLLGFSDKMASFNYVKEMQDIKNPICRMLVQECTG